MAKVWSTLSRQWQDAINFVLGAWLVLSPWLLGYMNELGAARNAYATGAIIAVAALAALVAFHRWEEWVNAILGVWLVVSPWIIGFSGVAYALWNQIIVGIIVAALALWAYYSVPHEAAHA